MKMKLPVGKFANEYRIFEKNTRKDKKIMIQRSEYRGCLKAGILEEDWKMALAEARTLVQEQKENDCILTVCLYQHKNMLFLYMETLQEGICPSKILSLLTPYLELWPEENGLTPWAPMYHIYHHSIPGEVSEWIKERATNEKRIGRIAFLKPEKLFSYTYWHYAIVQEGLLKGDKYQYISLHENVLFSYFEEPRHNVNITGKEKESKVIDGWMAVDPESHFDREKAGGNNFLVIEPVLMV